MTAMVVFSAKVFPMVLRPMITNGMLIAMMSMWNGAPLMAELSKDIPVAPPSINSLGNKNALEPNAAENMPTIIFAVSNMWLNMMLFEFFSCMVLLSKFRSLLLVRGMIIVV
jgi:hypothetical protein